MSWVWHRRKHAKYAEIVDEHGTTVAYQVRPEYAPFIVAAVNAARGAALSQEALEHGVVDDLLGACEAVQYVVHRYPDPLRPWPAVKALIGRALAKVKGAAHDAT